MHTRLFCYTVSAESSCNQSFMQCRMLFVEVCHCMSHTVRKGKATGSDAGVLPRHEADLLVKLDL